MTNPLSIPSDMLMMEVVEDEDAVQYGVAGMRWGVRRSRAERAAAKTAAKPEAKKAPVKAAEAKKPAGNIQDNVESSPERYARLAGVAKAGKAGGLSDQDLKFYNARTEALAKINKMNETKPGWLAETSKKVLLQTGEETMKAVASGASQKLISGPIVDAIGKAAKQKKN